MSGEESYVRARWAAAAADAAELRGQLDAAGRTEVLLRARVADLEEKYDRAMDVVHRLNAGRQDRLGALIDAEAERDRLRARVAELEEALGPFAEWWERYGGSNVPYPAEGLPWYCYRASVILSSGAEPGAGGGQQT